PGPPRCWPCWVCSTSGSTSGSGPRWRSEERTMEVILRDDVDKLGHRGDVVKVADGYGRNFLLPRGLALPVTDSNRATIEREKKTHAAKAAKEKAELETLA